MRILILSCNTGQGHNSCAAAIREVCRQNGDVCEIADALSFISERMSRFISNWHVRIYRYLPWLFRVGYRLSEKHPGVFRDSSGIYRLLTAGSERLRQHITAGAYDCVICTHVFSALILTEILKKNPLPVQSCFVATDYTCSPGTADSELDLYFIPDAQLEQEFITGNITSERAVPVGIPVRQMFFDDLNREQARKNAGIPDGHRHLLAMCGSMGCGPLPRLVSRIGAGLTAEQDMTVICGTNQRLYRKLKRRCSGRENIHILGYVDNVPELMESADLYLTKPGGVSVTEAVVRKLPMVFVDAVAGCEDYNRKFFLELGAAAAAPTTDALAELCLDLLGDDARLEKMSAALDGHIRGNPAVRLCEYLHHQADAQEKQTEEAADEQGG